MVDHGRTFTSRSASHARERQVLDSGYDALEGRARDLDMVVELL